MLEHSRSGIAEKQLTNINKLCDEFVNLAYYGMRATVSDFKCSIEKHLANDLPEINVVYQDISRVLLNLINNAFYAIKDKEDGKLEIITESASLSFIRIRIKDNGTGISDSIKHKIFEPFFIPIMFPYLCCNRKVVYVLLFNIQYEKYCYCVVCCCFFFYSWNPIIKCFDKLLYIK